MISLKGEVWASCKYYHMINKLEKKNNYDQICDIDIRI